MSTTASNQNTTSESGPSQGARKTLRHPEDPSMIGIQMPRNNRGYGIYTHTLTKAQYDQYQATRHAHIQERLAQS